MQKPEGDQDASQLSAQGAEGIDNESDAMILPDNETKVDLLNNEAIANTIIGLLRERPDTPVTIGVHGDWGAGKSSVLEMIAARLDKEDIYVTLLLAGAELGEDDKGFGKLIAAARERLKRPWESAALDAEAVKQALGDQATKTHNALLLSDQIGPILASGAKGNPRQIKRFLNTLLLRERTATARGFGDDIKLPVLAKLMLLERFTPRLFDQIASTAAAHPKGLCDDVAKLEAFATAAAAGTEKSAEPKAAKAVEAASQSEEESVALQEWKATEAMCSWARVLPAIGGLDLRPYLFVTKDKKDFFGPISVLGHLAAVADKLFGPKLIVQGHLDELRQLKAAEADKVFEAVRGRIIGAAVFDTLPDGIHGLRVLVQAQPLLQGRLIDFLESLPKARCGPWVTGGWQGVIVEATSTARFDALLGEWSKVGGNATLKAAAQAVLQQPRGKS